MSGLLLRQNLLQNQIIDEFFERRDPLAVVMLLFGELGIQIEVSLPRPKVIRRDAKAQHFSNHRAG